MLRTDGSRRLLNGAFELSVLAAVAVVPLLATKPGMLAADTKQYLYLDPGRLMASALSMWDPSVAGGTVTHQNVGYLFPQGPFYYLLEEILRCPPWVAQRLWMAGLLFAAGAGVRYLARTVGLSGGGVLVAALAYELSPYAMQYIERISAILMPFAALGWLVAFTVRALRRQDWRHPALFAIVAAAAGGTNATSILFVGLAPVIWIFYAVFATREIAPGPAVRATLRIGVLTVATALWWVAGLATEGAYGIDVLRYTETLPAIAMTSLPSEVIRGLGYWYFYGAGRLGPWLGAAVDYEERLGLLVTSFALPTLGALGAAITRWRERAYFLILLFVGVVFAVGAHPYSRPSLVGGGLKTFMTTTTAGLALRSSDRATPLVILGFTMLLGAAVSALWARARWPAVPVSLLAGALAAVNATPLLTGAAVATNFERVANLPAYDAQAANYLDARGARTRVLVEPGQDFADYTYGDTVDPIWPGLMTRPTIQRQQLIDGSLATADLLGAFDRQFQQGTYDPATLAPIARLLSAGDVLWQSNLAFWRYDTPLPKAGWASLMPPPSGIGTPVDFGGHRPNVAPAGDRLIDEQALSLPANQPWPPTLAVFPVSGARPIDRTEPATAPLVVDGSGAGLVDAAATGLLSKNPTIFYAGTLDGHPALASKVLVPGASLVVTDTNAKTLDRFESERDNVGEILPAHPGPTVPDPTKVPLPVFGHQPPSDQTIAQYQGAVYVSASSYGNSVALTPENRPYMAFDANSETAWSTAAFATARGQWLQVKLAAPTVANHLDLSQVLGSSQNRWITKVTLRFDGGHAVTERLGPASHAAGGEVLTFPRRRFQTLRITVDATTWHGENYTGASGVGFSSVSIPGVRLFEWIRMPEDLLKTAGASSSSHRLALVFDRRRVSPFPPRSDPEPFMARRFSLPTGRTFSLSGTARISALIPGNEIDALLGGKNVFHGAVIGANERLPGDLNARAALAFDGNPHTVWSPGFDAYAQVHGWVEAALPSPISFDHMNLQLVADGRHSVPTELRITSNAGTSVLVHVPPIRDRRRAGSVVSVPLHFPRLSGTTFRFSVVKVRRVTTINWYSQRPITMPVGIADMGVPGIHVTPENPRARIPAVCRGNLLRVDGKPVWLEVTGTVGTAENGGGLTVKGCGPDAHGLHLGPGTHTLLTTAGQTTGLNLDQLVLDSAPGGAGEPPLANGSVPPVAGTLGPDRPLTSPSVTTLSSGPDGATLRLSGLKAGHRFWLVLGQSVNPGWVASFGGKSLGHSVLIDGYANGWYVDPSVSGTAVVSFRFTPQRFVDVALGLSGAALALCVLLAVLPDRWRRRLAGRTRRLWWRGGNRAAAETGAPIVAPQATGPTFALSRAARARPGLVPTLLATVVSGVLVGVVLPPSVALFGGVGAGALVLLGVTLGWPRLALRLGAVGLLAASGAFVVAHQHATRFPPGSQWPTQFATAGVMAFLAVAALLADALVDLARREAAAPADTSPAAGLAQSEDEEAGEDLPSP